jgi:hypothetical protein
MAEVIASTARTYRKSLRLLSKTPRSQCESWGFCFKPHIKGESAQGWGDFFAKTKEQISNNPPSTINNDINGAPCR